MLLDAEPPRRPQRRGQRGVVEQAEQRGGQPRMVPTRHQQPLDLVADHLGGSAAFLSLAAVGLFATVLVGTIMPETRAPEPG